MANVQHELEQLQGLEQDRPQKVEMRWGVKGALVALAPVAAAAITLVTTFGWAHWTATQTALVATEVGAAIGLISAVVAHYYPGTPKEHVAVAATFVAWISASLAVVSGFGWWTLTQEEISALGALVTAVIGVGGALFARGKVFNTLTTRAPDNPGPTDPADDDSY